MPAADAEANATAAHVPAAVADRTVSAHTPVAGRLSDTFSLSSSSVVLPGGAGQKKAEENYARARAAVKDYLTAVNDDPRLKEPGLSPLRAELLQSALGFYQQFLRERSDDPALRKELASVYYKVGQIYSDLGQPRPANQSDAQSRRLYEALAAESPDDPGILDGLARALAKQGQQDRAIAIWEKLVRPDDPRYLYELGSAYSNLALRHGGRPATAQRAAVNKGPGRELK